MIDSGYGTDFASDNHAGAHPAVLAAVADANSGTADAYGGDPWTRHFEAHVRSRFGDDAAGFAVLNGTGANVLSLSLMLDNRYEAVICPESAHIATHEAGATERLLGVKLIAPISISITGSAKPAPTSASPRSCMSTNSRTRSPPAS